MAASVTVTEELAVRAGMVYIPPDEAISVPAGLPLDGPDQVHVVRRGGIAGRYSNRTIGTAIAGNIGNRGGHIRAKTQRYRLRNTDIVDA